MTFNSYLTDIPSAQPLGDTEAPHKQSKGPDTCRPSTRADEGVGVAVGVAVAGAQ